MATASIVLSTVKSARALGGRSGRALRSAVNAMPPHYPQTGLCGVLCRHGLGRGRRRSSRGPRGFVKAGVRPGAERRRGNSRLPSVPDGGAGVRLAPASVPATPAPPSLANAAPLRAHEIFGFAPYWTLARALGSMSRPFDAGVLLRRRARRRQSGPFGRRVERLREPGSGIW